MYTLATGYSGATVALAINPDTKYSRTASHSDNRKHAVIYRPLASFVTNMACIGILSFACITTLGVQAQEKSPVETLKHRDAILRDLIDLPEEAARDSLLREAIVSGFDFERHSRISLGRYWRERTKAEQEEFVSALRQWTENRAIKQLLQRSDTTAYDGEEVKGRRALVRTTVHYKGTRTLVDYKMELNKDGDWLIYDMTVDGASVALANRDAFYKKINQSSYEELLRTLHAKSLESDA